MVSNPLELELQVVMNHLMLGTELRKKRKRKHTSLTNGREILACIPSAHLEL